MAFVHAPQSQSIVTRCSVERISFLIMPKIHRGMRELGGRAGCFLDGKEHRVCVCLCVCGAAVCNVGPDCDEANASAVAAVAAAENAPHVCWRLICMCAAYAAKPLIQVQVHLCVLCQRCEEKYRIESREHHTNVPTYQSSRRLTKYKTLSSLSSSSSTHSRALRNFM